MPKSTESNDDVLLARLRDFKVISEKPMECNDVISLTINICNNTSLVDKVDVVLPQNNYEVSENESEEAYYDSDADPAFWHV